MFPPAAWSEGATAEAVRGAPATATFHYVVRAREPATAMAFCVQNTPVCCNAPCSCQTIESEEACIGHGKLE